MSQFDMFGCAPVGNRDCWRTPLRLFDFLNSKYAFTWDLASSDDNALCAKHYTEEDDALIQPWMHDGWLFINPPFSMLPAFFEKLHNEVSLGARVVAVVPGHRHEQDWFHRHVLGVASEILVPRGRVEYVAESGIGQSGPSFPSLILVFGNTPPCDTKIRSLNALVGTDCD